LISAPQKICGFRPLALIVKSSIYRGDCARPSAAQWLELLIRLGPRTPMEATKFAKLPEKNAEGVASLQRQTVGTAMRNNRGREKEHITLRQAVKMNFTLKNQIVGVASLTEQVNRLRGGPSDRLRDNAPQEREFQGFHVHMAPTIIPQQDASMIANSSFVWQLSRYRYHILPWCSTQSFDSCKACLLPS
jgi:hypothetical protein